MKKEKLKSKKRKLKLLLRGDYYVTFVANDYYVGTFDYGTEEILKPIKDLSRVPCWDWFVCSNKKKNHFHYVGFGLPNVDEKFDKENIISRWAIEDSCSKFSWDESFKKIAGSNLYQLIISEKERHFRKSREEFYGNNNNWIKTEEAWSADNKRKKSLNNILVSVNREGDGWDVIVPFSFNDKSIQECFSLALPVAFGEKKGIVNLNIINEYQKEIEYKRYV